jgi:hypothetical protein
MSKNNNAEIPQIMHYIHYTPFKELSPIKNHNIMATFSKKRNTFENLINFAYLKER